MNELPKDLAHPRGEYTHLIANVVVGVLLLVIAAGTVAFGFLVTQ